MLNDFAVDDAYITFRHAQNLVNGDGFSFNPGDSLLSTTSPLHALLLALIAFAGFNNLPLAAVWLSALSMIALSAGILLIFLQQRSPITGYLCVLLLLSQHWLYRFFSLETILVLALNIWSIALVLGNRWRWAGFVSGLAAIARPDSVVLAGTVVLLILFARKYPYRELWHFAASWVGGYGMWCLFSLVYFGSPFPNTLAAKSGFATWTVFIENIWPKMLRDLTPNYWQLSALLLFFAVIGFLDLLANRSPLVVLPLWAIFHTVGYTLLRIDYPFAWYYAPLILVTVVLGCVGGMTVVRYCLRWIGSSHHFLRRAPALGVGFMFFAIAVASIQGTWSFISTYETIYYAGARDAIYRQVGYWLRDNTKPDSSVALQEVGTIGYFSQRRIMDLAGLVTYELRNLPKQGTYSEVLQTLQPDYVIGRRGLPPDPGLEGIDGYVVVQRFPKGPDNLFEDMVIYKLQE